LFWQGIPGNVKQRERNLGRVVATRIHIAICFSAFEIKSTLISKITPPTEIVVGGGKENEW
jgi:hypothetical protein